ncbi:MAG: Bifunctional protein: zinc-containing alcohol dehydrogenase, partial [Gemmatimonadetes bacterium]|nr:Bifunctional protein: zinc-containing alcohol dehydrogenase [Gemmatimonadota bacterium]
MSPARRKAASQLEKPTIPDEMKAAGIDKFGPPSALTVRTVPVPRPGPREVLIAVHAAGVGIWDAHIRDGSWAEGEMQPPMTLGTDGAGVIVEMGDRVRRWQLGDRVWAFEYDNPKGGFYAEYVAVDTDSVGSLPLSLTMQEGGAASITGLTALQGVVDHLAVRKGETVMIFGASGAVGSLAVQFAARHRRARVIAIASGPKAKVLLEKLGAETVIDGRRPNALDRMREAAPDGIDAILALAGSPVLTKALRLVKHGGRIAYPNGVEPAPRERKGVRVIGYDAETSTATFEKLRKVADAIDLAVPVAHAYPLNRAAQAHARI